MLVILHLDHARAIGLRVGRIALDKTSAGGILSRCRTGITRHDNGELVSSLRRHQCHRALPTGSERINRAGDEGLWNDVSVIINGFSGTVIQIQHALGQVSTPVRYEGSGHQHGSSVLISVEREGIVAL